jgi:hypothetical protein
MKKYLIAISFLILISECASAITIDRMKELIVINNSGSADIDAELTILRMEDSVLYYPIRFSNATDFEVEPKEQFDFTIISENNTTMLKIVRKKVVGDTTTILISFYVSHIFNIYEHPVLDFKSKQFANKLQILTFDKISDFISGVVLPEGYVISNVNSFSSEGENSTYNISNNGIRESIEIKSTNIKKGQSASVDFTFRAANKTKVTIAIVIASLLVFIFVLRMRRRVNKKR